MTGYLVTRRIGIDAGHRIRSHGSKCRHVHGHRYEIEASCRAQALHEEGVQRGMALDFGFLKEEMMAVIDGPCDHGFIAEIADTELLTMFAPATDADAWLADLRMAVARDGYALTEGGRLATKLYVLSGPPTAERLAEHWFARLAPRVAERSQGIATLARLRVWETPNCWAEWSDGAG